MLPDDPTLAQKAAEIGKGQVLLIACGALAREVLAVNRTNGADHFTLHCLPALLHNTPEKIPDAVRMAIAQGRKDGFTRIFLLYADCGTGGLLDRVCEEENVERITGPHCYSFFDGNDVFAARGDDEMRCFYLTDFLVRQFDAFVWEPLGLDRHPELRDMYFGHYERLIYLAQTDDPALDTLAQRCARRLGLEYTRRFTGYGDLASSLSAIKA
jgi:hypothetical protein